MERLTERNKHGGIVVPMDGVQKDVMFMRLAHALAAYEDAEEQGLLVRLPCKPATLIYLVGNNKVFEYSFMGITQSLNYAPILFGKQKFGNRMDVGIAKVTSWGKTVFLTRAEAEAALAAMKGEQP